MACFCIIMMELDSFVEVAGCFLDRNGSMKTASAVVFFTFFLFYVSFNTYSWHTCCSCIRRRRRQKLKLLF